PMVYDYAKFDRGILPEDREDVWAHITANPSTVQWALNSPGPDTRVHEYLGYTDLTVYDPTNGTVSFGQIIRTNQGADDKPKQYPANIAAPPSGAPIPGAPLLVRQAWRDFLEVKVLYWP